MRSLIFILLLVTQVIVSGCNSAGATRDPGELYKNYTPEQLYNSGVRSIYKREYSIAIRYFEALDSLYPFSPYSEKGDLALIYAYYMAEDYASTVAAANRFIRLYPRNEHADYAYYMKGHADLNQIKTSHAQRMFNVNTTTRDLSEIRQAFFDYRDLIAFYPDSRYAPDARQRMIYVRNLLAEYELEIAKYYMQRRAYVAASNRASYLIEHFPRTPQVKEALIILIKANRAMGLAGPASDAEQVLQANFPKVTTY